MLSGSMYISGSDFKTQPIAALVFEKDGDMRLLMIDKSDDNDKESILLISDFFQYALSKDSWMKEFIGSKLNISSFSHDDTDHSILDLIYKEFSHVSGSDMGNLLN